MQLIRESTEQTHLRFPLQLLHRIAAVIFVILAMDLSIDQHLYSAEEKKPGVPNIVLILADDLGYADVGFQGCKDVPTPHIDSLAAHGMRCTSGYVSHPFCSPTRAGLMTGRYQQRFGHENNPAYLPEDTSVGLPLDQKTVASYLSDAGYVTGVIGKWHLGAAPCFHPNQRGFREYFGFLGGGHGYFPAAIGSTEYAIPILRNQEPTTPPAYLTDGFGAEAAAFINRHKSEPFFLYLAFNAVHTPLQAPADAISKYAGIADEKRRTYAAMLDSMDRAIGQVLGALQEGNLEEKTLVVFLSDNGGPLDANGSRNTPLRGAKGSVFEGGIRVPFVLQWRGTLPEGSVYDQPVISLDLAPTAITLAGVKTPELAHLDGVNLMPHLLGEVKEPPHKTLLWRTGGGASWAVRSGDWKLLKTAAGQPELYNLKADLSETTNEAAARPELVQSLGKEFDGWNAQLVPPKWENPRAARAQATPKKDTLKKGAAKKKAATAPKS